MITLELTGYKELDNLFQQLPIALSHKIIGQANFAAAAPLVEKEKLLAPEGPTGNLVDSIGAIKRSISKASVVGEVIVGPRRGGKYKGYAAHLVEYGTVKRQLKKNGANRGIMPAHPFAKPAFDATKDRIESSIGVNLGKVVLRTMKRYAKK